MKLCDKKTVILYFPWMSVSETKIGCVHTYKQFVKTIGWIYMYLYVCNTCKSQNTAEAQSNYCTTCKTGDPEIGSFLSRARRGDNWGRTYAMNIYQTVTVYSRPVPSYAIWWIPSNGDTCKYARQSPIRVTCGCRWLFISNLVGAYLMGVIFAEIL